MSVSEAGRRLRAAVPSPARVAPGARVALAALPLALALAASLPIGRWVAGHRPRNVVLVVVDTLRADHLGSYGYGRGTSPRLDGFASEAFVFDRARSTASWTRPAIASLLTSQYPFEHGIYRERPRDRLSAATPTLQQIVRQRGLHAKAIVAQPHYRSGMDRDFDSFVFEGRRDAEALYDRAIAFLDEHGGEPFFLLVHNIDPHDGYRFHEGFSDLPSDSQWRSSRSLLPAHEPDNGIGYDSLDNRVVTIGPEALAELESNYDGEIRYLDHHFGRFLDALEARGLMDDTLIVVTADHGEEFLDHGSYWHGGTLYEELVRVPLIVRAPGLGRGRSAAPVSLVDVLPTVAEWIGAPLPETARGRSLLPLLRGEPAGPRPIFSATGFRQQRIQQSVVLGGKKLIRRADGEFVGLFDLERDPEERHDLGSADPDRARLEAWLPAPTRRPPRTDEAKPAPEMDEELKAALEALGYATD